MKKVLFTLLSLFIFVSIPNIPQAYAVENIQKAEVVTLPKNKVINSDYFAAGEAITISGTINGDAYIASGKITINGIINGDLFAAGGDILINGTVKNNIRVAGGNITVLSPIGGNATIIGGNTIVGEKASISGSLVGVGGNMELFSPIGKGVTLAGGNVRLGEKIGGDVTAGVGNFHLLSGSKVFGNLTYWSDKKVIIEPESSVSGKTTYHEIKQSNIKKAPLIGIFAGLKAAFGIADFIATLVLGLFLLYVAPVLTHKLSEIILVKPGKTMLVGLIGLFGIPIIGVLFMITIIGIPIGVILFALFGFAIYLGRIFVMYALGVKAFSLTNKKAGNVLMLLVGIILFKVLSIIPIIGSIFHFLAILAGLGAIITIKLSYYNTLREKKLI